MALKIISGQAKGVALISPKTARPSSSMMREAIINMLKYNPDFNKTYTMMMDICAGSGAIGLEFLSNQISQAGIFVENDHDNYATLQKNITKITPYLGENNTITLLQKNAYHLTKKMLPALPDLVFLDPPYHEDAQKLYDYLQGAKLLEKCHLLIIQTAPDKTLKLPFTLMETRKYGNALLHFYHP